MKRQLFLHHYLPALYFAVILSARIFEAAFSSLAFLLSKVRPSTTDEQTETMKKVILGALLIATVATFIKFAPLGYGLRMSKRQCVALKWLSRWDFDCGSLIDSVGAAIVT